MDRLGECLAAAAVAGDGLDRAVMMACKRLTGEVVPRCSRYAGDAMRVLKILSQYGHHHAEVRTAGQDGGWVALAGFYGRRGGFVYTKAETPELAVARLVVRLLREGHLDHIPPARRVVGEV